MCSVDSETITITEGFVGHEADCYKPYSQCLLGWRVESLVDTWAYITEDNIVANVNCVPNQSRPLQAVFRVDVGSLNICAKRKVHFAKFDSFCKFSVYFKIDHLGVIYHPMFLY